MNGGERERPRIHAALVHFPVSAWAGAVAIRLMHRIGSVDTLARIDAQSAMTALVRIGLAGAALAAIAGLVEYARLPDDEPLLRRANRHMLLMGAASLCFLPIALQAVITPGLPTFAADLLYAAGGVLLLAGGHHGGRLVSQRWAVQADRAPAAPSAPR